jgi:predicted RNase H-like nuclease
MQDATRVKKDLWLAGADGCRDGWVVVLVRPTGEDARIEIVPNFSSIAAMRPAPAVVAVDMPIGLPEFSPVKGRHAERLVRPLLGDRKSSVFRIPSRSAVCLGASDDPPDDKARFLRACEIARETSEDGKAFSKQGFYIFRKIVEVDLALRSDPTLAKRTFEIHPEVAFWRLNGEKALGEPKKRRNRPYEPGMTLRRGLLTAAGLPRGLVDSDPPKGAAADDLLDALACATIARRIHAGIAEPFPNPPPRDAYRLPMAIWA